MEAGIREKIRDILSRRTFNELIEYYYSLDEFDRVKSSEKIREMLKDDSINTRLTPAQQN